MQNQAFKLRQLGYIATGHLLLYILPPQDGSSLLVKQFQTTTWPEEGVPETAAAMIDLIGQVQKWQMNSGNKPIVVHCR